MKRIAEKPTNPSPDDVFALLMDMGTGKTKVIVDEFGERVAAKDLSDILVLAPAGSYRNWDLDRGPEEPSEFTKHMDPAIRERLVCNAWVSGAGAQHKRGLDALLACKDRPRALVVNVEALSSVKAAHQLCEAFLKSSKAPMIVVDESTVIRNSTERTKRALALGKLAVSRRIATGLATPRSPMDLFYQFGFLDWRILGFRSFFAFRQRYAVLRKMNYGGRSFFTEVGYRDLPELQAKIAPYSYRVLKDDCLDLEPKVYLSRDVSLTPEQNRIYREIKQFATSALNGIEHVTATSVITQILRLHQVLCGHVTDENGNIHDIPENRTGELMDVLSEHGGKAIVWATYDRTIRKIAARLSEEYGQDAVACYWGGNRGSRNVDEARFKTDPKCRFMVSTPAAGGRGNTWTVANLEVYYANNYDLEQRQQSEDRPHRHGQTKSVTIVDLIARGTVDEKIILALRRKINLATTITGENYRQWLI